MWTARRCGLINMLWEQKGGPGCRSARPKPRRVQTKVHLRAEGKGEPMTFVLTPGQRHEAVIFPQLMEQGAVKRSGRGRDAPS